MVDRARLAGLKGAVRLTLIAGMTVAPHAAGARAAGNPSSGPPPVSGPWLPPGNPPGLAGLPVAFVPNAGQFDPAVRFQAAVGGATAFVTADGLTIVRALSVLSLRFEAANPFARVVPGRRLPGVSHYLRGHDPSRWVTQVPSYAGVTYQDLYPGIDLRLESDGGRGLRLAFDVAPGADPDVIRWRWRDADGRPVAAGREDATLRAVVGRAGDTTDSVMAAPTLIFSTFLGGRFNEMIRGLAVDNEGFAYVAGTTTSLDFPTAKPLQPGMGNSGSLQDAFIAKLNPEGTALVYSTFLGGSRQDEAFGLAIDRVGRAHVTGYTTSPDFPMEKPLQPGVHLADGIFSGDAFVTKLTPDGAGLEFSTPWGGTSRDIGKGIAVDGAGLVYVTGWTGSNFPAVNAVHPLNRGVRDAFLLKLSSAGDNVVYSTHLGGSFADEAKRIAVDGAGNAYIVGTTESLNFRVTAPFQRVIAGDTDAFVAKLSADGSAFAYSTYLGGRGNNHGIDIAVSQAGEAYVLGQTDSPNFPRKDALQNSRLGPSDLFVTRLSAAGDALVFSTYLGGNADEGDCVPAENPRQLTTPTPDPRGLRYLEGSKFTDGPVGGIAVDAAGRVFVTSCTRSGNLGMVNPIQATRPGIYGLMLSVLDPPGAKLLFSTYLGGRSMNVARALALGGDGGIYVAGQTDSTDFPMAPAGGPLQGARSGTSDAFVLKIGGALDDAPTPTPGPTESPPTDEASPTPTEIMPTGTSTPTPTIEGTPTIASTHTARPSATATETQAPGRRLIWLPMVDRE